MTSKAKNKAKKRASGARVGQREQRDKKGGVSEMKGEGVKWGFGAEDMKEELTYRNTAGCRTQKLC